MGDPVGADLNRRLHAAIEQGLLEAARACLKHGADPNAVGEFDDTALRVAIGRTQDPKVRVALVELLLVYGADPKQRHTSGGGPLFAAMIQYDPEVLKILLVHGADPNLEHDSGEPLFDWSDICYRYDEYGPDLPELPAPEDTASSAAWALFLDRLASKYGKTRPVCLNLIAEYGARGWRDGVSWIAKGS